MVRIFCQHWEFRSVLLKHDAQYTLINSRYACTTLSDGRSVFKLGSGTVSVLEELSPTWVSTIRAMSMNMVRSSLMLASRRMMSWWRDSISFSACRVIWESEIIWGGLERKPQSHNTGDVGNLSWYFWAFISPPPGSAVAPCDTYRTCPVVWTYIRSEDGWISAF